THAIILRGDATGLGETTYAITPGGATCFVEWGGTWKFRQVRNTTNDVRMEILPTHVNIPTSLQVGGYTAGMRPFVSCAVKLDGVRYWTRGQQTATTARTPGGSAFGDYTVSWGTPHPDGADYVPQYCLINSWGNIYSGTRTATSIQIRVTDSVGGGLDRDFFFTLH
ncbi:MAG: hypothetical protein KGN78_14450, partial [Actinomycetales bacterium]|nr:hypothetical protein [Actinomycetales bacterium]